MDLAVLLGMSKQRCQVETTSSEFMDWLVWQEEDFNRPSRADYYAAQTAMEVRRANVKDSAKVKNEDGILKFKTEAPKPLEDLEDVKAQRIANSKAAWGALLGAGSKPNVKKKPVRKR